MDDYGRRFWSQLIGLSVGLPPEDSGVQRCVHILFEEMKTKDMFLCLPREEIESYDDEHTGKGEVHHRDVYIFSGNKSFKISKSMMMDHRVNEHRDRMIDHLTRDIGTMLAQHLFDNRTMEPRRTVRDPRCPDEDKDL
jgi:hypothetical protein